MSKDFRNVGGRASVPEKNPPHPDSTQASDRSINVDRLESVGRGGFIVSAIIAIWFALLAFILFNYSIAEDAHTLTFIDVVGYILLSISLMHILVLLKIELARKFAVAHGYLLLLGIPIGTVLGIFVLRTLKGKKFY